MKVLDFGLAKALDPDAASAGRDATFQVTDDHDPATTQRGHDPRDRRPT